MRNPEDIATKLLGVPFEGLDERTKKVARRMAGRKHIARNLSKDFDVAPSMGQRAADAVASFRDPSEYPRVSVASSGTHDTEPQVVWWERASADDREKVSRLPTIQQLSPGVDLMHSPYNPAVRDALLEALFASNSNLLLIPIQDAFGWRARINEPATVTDDNWTYRLPWPVDKLHEVPEACERKEQLRAW